MNDYHYSHANYGRSWLLVAGVCTAKGDKRTRRVALKIYRRSKKQRHRQLIHQGKTPR